jgi:hypothetical protein
MVENLIWSPAVHTSAARRTPSTAHRHSAVQESSKRNFHEKSLFYPTPKSRYIRIVILQDHGQEAA